MADFRATYRLQLGGELDFAAAAELVPYLSELGVSHLYLSPAFAARAGSTHGYDVTDPTRISDALGGEEGFRALAAAARAAGLGIVLDIVPNHMATDDANPYWADEQRRAKFFDLDPETGRHRRFFDIDHLAGVRQEDPEVFAETHRLALGLVGEGLVDGLRVDHPDGLADPAGYLERLRDGGVEHVWVEKILDPGEQLRDWPVEGTVGYEFLNDACALFVDPAGEAALTRLWTELSGDARPFGEWAARGQARAGAHDVRPRRRVAAAALAGRRGARGGARRAARLPHLHPRPARARGPARARRGGPDGVARAGAAAVPAALPAADAADHGQGRRGHGVLPLRAAARALRRRRRPEPLLDRRRRRSTPATPRARRASRVTCSRARRTTRSARATCARGSARSPAWRRTGPRPCGAGASCARRCASPGAPDAVEEYTIFQTLVGAWPIEPERLFAYMCKAMREAKRNTRWVEPDGDWEERVLGYCRALYEHAEFRADFEPFAARVAAAGELHALRQTALKLTVPGVPDIYQGDELVALSLVDPDNRRPVDWARRRELLAALRDGAEPDGPDARKLWLIRALLALRARRPAAFAGAYTPLDAGADAVAFLRGDDVAVALPLREGGLDMPSLPPGDWRAVFDPELLPGAEIHVFERG